MQYSSVRFVRATQLHERQLVQTAATEPRSSTYANASTSVAGSTSVGSYATMIEMMAIKIRIRHKYYCVCSTVDQQSTCPAKHTIQEMARTMFELSASRSLLSNLRPTAARPVAHT